ncbi:MAG: DNA repair protein RecO [Phycisphaerae bacterium]|nr:DNA repair protein RecO [Phycisphaerae bacterium]
MPISELAICLRRSDYSETSLVVRMMTREHGQASLMAKGVKRPKSRFGGSIDLLSVGQAVYSLPRENSVSTMGLLMSWDQTEAYPCLRTDLLRHAVALTAAELLARLTEELDPHPASFDAMIRLLRELQGGEPPVRRLAEFGRALLTDIGLTPDFQTCAHCGQPTGPGEFPAARGLLFAGPRSGVLCPRCQPGPGESTVAISRNLQQFFIENTQITGRLALEFVRWLVYYVQHQIGRELNSAATLERAIAAALIAHARSAQPTDSHDNDK